jgi:hypothetical protein
MTVRSLRKREIKQFLLDHLGPRLQDQDWLLLDDEGLVKVRDETTFGLHTQRSDVGPSFVFWVSIRPLYWPASLGAVGIGDRIGRWCHPREGLGEGWVDLGSPDLAEETAHRLAPVINTRVAPWLAQFPDGEAVLQSASSWRHPFDPVFGWIQTGSNSISDLYAYMWAWSGSRRKARASLKAAISDIRHQVAHVRRELARGRRKSPPTPQGMEDESNYDATWDSRIAHLEHTLKLLDKPEELRAFLQETANKNRVESKLDRARLLTSGQSRR